MGEKNKKIDLDVAIQWTQNWRRLESDYNKYNQCNGFLVPVQDLIGAIEEMKGQEGQKYIRAYMGVDITTDDSGKKRTTEKLLIVGTRPEKDKDGKTVYRDLIGGSAAAVAGGDGGSIWDFSNPCPPDCDDKSDLN